MMSLSLLLIAASVVTSDAAWYHIHPWSGMSNQTTNYKEIKATQGRCLGACSKIPECCGFGFNLVTANVCWIFKECTQFDKFTKKQANIYDVLYMKDVDVTNTTNTPLATNTPTTSMVSTSTQATTTDTKVDYYFEPCNATCGGGFAEKRMLNGQIGDKIPPVERIICNTHACDSGKPCKKKFTLVLVNGQDVCQLKLN